MESNHDKIVDQWLDRAIEHYGEAEPRAGLEGRVLANLRAVNEQPSAWRGWWPAVAAGVLMLVGGASLWVSGHHRITKAVAIHAPLVSLPAAAHPTLGMTHEIRATEASGQRPVRRSLVQMAEAEPRLDMFPAPRPLSEQEKILVNYVARFHDGAALLAQEQVEIKKQNDMEMRQGLSSGFARSY